MKRNLIQRVHVPPIHFPRTSSRHPELVVRRLYLLFHQRYTVQTRNLVRWTCLVAYRNSQLRAFLRRATQVH